MTWEVVIKMPSLPPPSIAATADDAAIAAVDNNCYRRH